MAKILKVDTKDNSEKAIVLGKDSPDGEKIIVERSAIQQVAEKLSSYKNLSLEPWQIEVINKLGLVQEGFFIHACPYPQDQGRESIDWLSLKYNELTILNFNSWSKHDLAILREYGIAIGRLLLEPKLPSVFWHLLIEEIINIINPFRLFCSQTLLNTLLKVGFTTEEIHSRQELPNWKKKQYLLTALETDYVKDRLSSLYELNSEKQILPTHLLSSFTREEKRLYHLIMESKRTKASAQAIDASKISKEPSKEYIQTTSGIIMYPSENSYSNLSLENRYILALDSLTSQNNGASNEQQ